MSEEYTEADIPVYDKDGKWVECNINFETLKKQIPCYTIDQLLASHRWAAREELNSLHPYIETIEEEIKQRIGTTGKVHILPNTGSEVEPDKLSEPAEVELHET